MGNHANNSAKPHRTCHRYDVSPLGCSNDYSSMYIGDLCFHIESKI